MISILRWLMVLVLLALVAMSLFPALVGTIETYNLPIDLSAVTGASENLEQWAADTTIVERVLWYAAALFFFIAAVRLLRRTQGFWMWLLGFACLGVRWSLAQQQHEGGLASAIGEAASLQSYAPSELAQGGASAQLAFLVFLVVVGLIIFVVDADDRRYWARHGA